MDCCGGAGLLRRCWIAATVLVVQVHQIRSGNVDARCRRLGAHASLTVRRPSFSLRAPSSHEVLP